MPGLELLIPNIRSRQNKFLSREMTFQKTNPMLSLSFQKREGSLRKVYQIGEDEMILEKPLPKPVKRKLFLKSFV